MEPADHSASQRAAAADATATTPPPAKMYAGYNQYELKGVRIGNWVDEAALLEATGHNRGPRPGEPDFGIDNPERVIGAPGATHPKDWQSDYQAGFIDHTGRDNYRPMPDHGQREAAEAGCSKASRRGDGRRRAGRDEEKGLLCWHGDGSASVVPEGSDPGLHRRAECGATEEGQSSRFALGGVRGQVRV